MVASMVILIVMAALAYVTSSALVGVAFAKQRQTADQLLGKTMEQVRALPFSSVASGLSDNDSTVSSDGNISVSGSTWTYAGSNETIPHASVAVSPAQAPFLPHQTTTTLNATTYTIDAYPTVYSSASGAYRVTAIVSWVRSFKTGVSHQVSGQTIVYSPASGCLAANNHPFAAPCQPFLHATATSDTPKISIQAGSGWTGNPIAGIALAKASLTGVLDQTSLSIEQTSSALGTADSTAGLLHMTAGNDQTSGGVAASSSADNDPATSSAATNSATVSQGAGAVSSSSSGNSITLTPSTTDSGTTVSTAIASASPACTDLGGTTLLSSLPCGSGSISQSGTTMSAAMALAPNGAGLGSATLASIASQPAAKPTRVFAARLTSALGGYCTSTSGDGCVHAGAQRSFGTVALAGLPANIPGPTGWASASCNNTNALVSLVGYADSASTESGVSPASPAASQTGGTLYYWNGNGCTSKPVTWGSSAPTIAIPTIVANSSLGGSTTVTISGTVTLGATSTSTSTNSGCVSVCTAEATAASPVVASLNYVVVNNGTTIANLEMNVTLGDLDVTTSYQAAPS